MRRVAASPEGVQAETLQVGDQSLIRRHMATELATAAQVANPASRIA
jgi:hypothetical protein